MNREFFKKYKSIIGLILFSIIISIFNKDFLTVNNILNILRQTSINSIIAAGMTFVVLTGGIDLSVGSILAFSGAVCISMVSAGFSVFLAVIVALIIGSIIGILNGIFISKGKLQPFIATLATMTIVRGATLVFTDGRPITSGGGKGAQAFRNIGAGYFLKIPIPIYIMAIVFLISYYLLKHMKFGRYVYSLGGNEEATKLSGINVDKVKIFVYGISGFLAALAGIVMTSRLSSAQPNAGVGYELDAIASVVLGGTSLTGGVGSVLGTIVGALIIGIINNALNLMNVSSYYQTMVKGIVILLAVLLDRKND